MVNLIVIVNRVRKVLFSDLFIIGLLEDLLFWFKIIKLLFINYLFFKLFKKFFIEGCDKEKICYSIRVFNYK